MSLVFSILVLYLQIAGSPEHRTNSHRWDKPQLEGRESKLSMAAMSLVATSLSLVLAL